MIGQQKVAEKSNEITAIPTHLEASERMYYYHRCNGMSEQTNIAQAIIAKEVDYLSALKGNQVLLYQQIQQSIEVEKNYESSSEIDLGNVGPMLLSDKMCELCNK